MHYFPYESPVGPLLLAGDAGALRMAEFHTRARPIPPEWIQRRETFLATIGQLDEYFAGTRRDFDLTLDPAGTDFQRVVWRELQRIPHGATISYQELARRIGKPNAVRAVGTANGANPIPIIIPCHRVIGSGGNLTGYGGGLEIKERLLALEGARLPF
ncbi:MAG: methylated-DNA--[protein]-cysteine S-methyltransferase [Thermoanaerobaculia bacterium]